MTAGPSALPAFDLSAARRILVVKLDEAGDLVLATPFLRGLRASAPQASITLAVRPPLAELALRCPWVDGVVLPLVKPDGRGLDFRGATPEALARFMADFRAGFDLAIVPRYDLDRHGATTLVAASGARLSLGYSERVTPWKAEANAGFDRAYTHVLAASPGIHEVEHNLALLAHLGGRTDGAGTDAVALCLTEADRAAALRLTAGVADGRRLIAVAPGTASPRRNYPPDQLAAVTGRLCDALHADVVLLGTAEDAAAVAAVAQALPRRVHDLTGRTTLPEAAAVIERGALLLAMDSGPAHLAAAVGTPVAVFSCHPVGGDPTFIHAPERFRPWTRRALVLQPAAPVPPCTDSCRDAGAHCIVTIEPDRAAAAILDFLAALPATTGEPR
ncbi:MAG: glycosyltransferase family 9 protein [Alphaproteobacteria bacterium]